MKELTHLTTPQIYYDDLKLYTNSKHLYKPNKIFLNSYNSALDKSFALSSRRPTYTFL